MIGRTVEAPLDGTTGTVVKYDNVGYVVVVWHEAKDWQYDHMWDGQITVEPTCEIVMKD